MLYLENKWPIIDQCTCNMSWVKLIDILSWIYINKFRFRSQFSLRQPLLTWFPLDQIKCSSKLHDIQFSIDIFDLKYEILFWLLFFAFFPLNLLIWTIPFNRTEFILVNQSKLKSELSLFITFIIYAFLSYCLTFFTFCYQDSIERQVN